MTYLDQVADEIAREAGEADPRGSRCRLYLLYALLALVRGEAVERRDVHDAWVAWMAGEGEEHAAMVAFDELSAEVQAEDEPYVRAIREVARVTRMGSGGGGVR